MYSKFLLLLAALFAATLWFGCDDEIDRSTAEPDVYLNVRVASGTDTFLYVPGPSQPLIPDTLIVSARTRSGLPISGQRISVLASPFDNLNMSYANDLLRDTTDMNGQVLITLHPLIGNGESNLCAELLGVSECLKWSWAPVYDPINVTASADTIYALDGDGCYVTLYCRPWLDFQIEASEGLVSTVPPTQFNLPVDVGWVFTDYFGPAVARISYVWDSIVFKDSVRIFARQFDFATFSADFELFPDTVYADQEWIQPMLQVHILSNGTIPVPGLQFPYGLTSPFGSIPPFGNIGPTDENGFAETELPLNVGSTEWTYCVYISAFASYDTVCVTLIH